MTLTAILLDCYRRLRYTAAPPTTVTTRLTALINETHRDLLALPGMERLRDDVLPVVALANQGRSGLPPTVARINAMVDRTNNFKLVQVPLSELRLSDPAQAFTGGYPMRYSVIGNVAVQIQPAAATGLWVNSTSALDVGKAYVESVVTGGYPNFYITAGTTMTGATRAAIGSLATHIEVVKFFVDTVAAGYISLWDAAAAGNELARIPIGETFSRYVGVEWWPIQTANVTEHCDYTRAIVDLVAGTDEPLLPRDFHYLLAIGTRRKEYELLDDSRLVQADADYRRGIAALKSWVLNNGDQLASLRPLVPHWNNLGSQYPSTN
jgi:hypothetical protein